MHAAELAGVKTKNRSLWKTSAVPAGFCCVCCCCCWFLAWSPLSLLEEVKCSHLLPPLISTWRNIFLETFQSFHFASSAPWNVQQLPHGLHPFFSLLFFTAPLLLLLLQQAVTYPFSCTQMTRPNSSSSPWSPGGRSAPCRASSSSFARNSKEHT